MSKHRATRGATLVDVLAVCIALGLLLLVLAPTLARPRIARRMTDCLSNLRRIGTATQAYAAEDPHELIIPIHMNMVRTCSYWEWRAVTWFAWGGQSGTQIFKTSPSGGYWLSDVYPPPAGGQFRPAYAGNTRPLNSYIFPDSIDVFHCPADVGYPDHPDIDDSPRANNGRPCWDTLGNSYRASLGPLRVQLAGPSAYDGGFSCGPFGHRLSTLTNTSRLALLGDPLFFNLIGREDVQPPQPLLIPGWHGQVCADNLLFCDGSVRRTSAISVASDVARRPQSPDALGLDTPRVCVAYRVDLTAGAAFQIDAYPTPAAVIWGDWTYNEQHYSDCWPWMNAQHNLGGRDEGDGEPPVAECVIR